MWFKEKEDWQAIPVLNFKYSLECSRVSEGWKTKTTCITWAQSQGLLLLLLLLGAGCVSNHSQWCRTAKAHSCLSTDWYLICELFKSFRVIYHSLWSLILINYEGKKGEKFKFNSINGDTKDQHWKKIWQGLHKAHLFGLYYFLTIYEFQIFKLFPSLLWKIISWIYY